MNLTHRVQPIETPPPETNTPPLFVRFADSFLQEHNIKWILAVGLLILLSSSLLLVSANWRDYPPAWKYASFLTFAGAIYAAGAWTKRRLALWRTGTVLQVLTVFLIPITFLMLHWLTQQEADWFDISVRLALAGANLAFAAYAARTIFHEFLRGQQPTFLVCYLLLSVAGAIVPGLPVAWAPVVALALWAVFAVGSVKVNRHLFWLNEEQRRPRIFGFFPILLLGTQFLVLYALHAPATIGVDWLGFGCVLVAILILLTADTVARVFQQRTGNVVRPLPWPIIGPLVLGVALCWAGVVLAGTKVITPSQTQAFVVASILAAVMMGLIARRTGKQGFVWALLALVMCAYNFCPAFFAEMKRHLLESAASLVHEPRLPIAFYGLTYLPLLLVATIASKVRSMRKDDLFSLPLRYFSIGLGCVMLGISACHFNSGFPFKAHFPVALSMTVVFGLQVFVFRDGRLALLAVGSYVLAALAFAGFAVHVLAWTLPGDPEICFVLGAAVSLLIAGAFLDKRFANAFFPDISTSNQFAVLWRNILQSCSLMLTTALAFWWAEQIVRFAYAGNPIVSAALAALLIIHALKWTHPVLGGATILVAHAMLLAHATFWPLPIDSVMTLFLFVLLSQWSLTYLLAKVPQARIARTFRVANFWISGSWLLLGLIACILPRFAWDIAHRWLPISVVHLLPPLHGVDWLAGTLVVVWAFDAARRFANPSLTVLAAIGVLGAVGAAFIGLTGADGGVWLPAVWASTALAGLPIAEGLWRRSRTVGDKVSALTASVPPLYGVVLLVLLLASLYALVTFSVAGRPAGLVGIAGLLAFAYLRPAHPLRPVVFYLLNWQILSLAVTLLVPGAGGIDDLDHVSCPPLWLPLASLCAASLLAWKVIGDRARSFGRPVYLGHVGGLGALCALAVTASLHHPWLSGGDCLVAISIFALLVASELWSACQLQRECRVWTAEVLILTLLGYFAHFGLLPMGHGVLLFVILGIAVGLWLIAHVVQNAGRLAILGSPFRQTALALPAFTVVAGLVQHLTRQPIWLGANSLAVLLAAAFYFWRGLEGGDKRFLIRRVDDTSALAQFQRLEDRVLRAEALEEAYERLNGNDPAAAELARHFADQELKDRLQRELEELKRRVEPND